MAFVRQAAYLVFRLASRLLRNTSLRHVPWIVDLHYRCYGILRPAGPAKVGPFRIHIDPRDSRGIAKDLFLYGEHEPFEIEVLKNLVSPGETVVDIGANVGVHTLFASRAVGPTGTVIAVEPDPDNFALLKLNVSKNGVKNVRLVQKAVSDAAGSVALYQYDDNRARLSLRDLHRSGRSVQVEAVTVDELLAECSEPIALVKMDIEGAEPLALRGMSETMARNPRMILLMEFIPDFIAAFGVCPETLLQELEALAYEIIQIDPAHRALVPVVKSRFSVIAASGVETNLLCRRRLGRTSRSEARGT